MTLQAGCHVGRYEVASLIASGGMGDVYRARDTQLDRPVALKVLSANLLSDPERLTRFAQEARTTALISHPNILSVFDIGSDNGRPYVVSELLQGQTLRARLADGPLAIATAIDYACQIAHGLIAAHHLGVVHRDLKPENVFVTEDARVKVLDFGLASCRGEGVGLTNDSASTQPGTIIGTVGYMAPEQVRSAATDERSDIFSVGVMFYEMVAGVAPFRRETPVETLYAILKEEAPPLPPQRGVTADLEHVIRHCLEKAPSGRFQSVRDLAFVLQFMLRTPPAAPPRTKASRFVEALLSLF